MHLKTAATDAIFVGTGSTSHLLQIAQLPHFLITLDKPQIISSKLKHKQLTSTFVSRKFLTHSIRIG
jgi:hypothetical protein